MNSTFCDMKRSWAKSDNNSLSRNLRICSAMDLQLFRATFNLCGHISNFIGFLRYQKSTF